MILPICLQILPEKIKNSNINHQVFLSKHARSLVMLRLQADRQLSDAEVEWDMTDEIKKHKIRKNYFWCLKILFWRDHAGSQGGKFPEIKSRRDGLRYNNRHQALFVLFLLCWLDANLYTTMCSSQPFSEIMDPESRFL